MVVFDRGIPDCIVYAIRAGIDQTPNRDAAQAFPYEREVFFLNPSSDIYETDEERIVSFEDTVSFGRSQRDVYREFGYTLIDVPRGSVDERAGFITRRIAESGNLNRAAPRTPVTARGEGSARASSSGAEAR